MSSLLQTALKLWLCLTFVLKYPLSKDDQERARLFKFQEDDFKFCPECFQETCTHIVDNIIFEEDFVGTLNNLFGVKQIRYGRFIEDGRKVVIKYVGSKEKFDYILGGFYNQTEIASYISSNENSERIFQELFFDKNKIDGCQFCPSECVDRFLTTLRSITGDLTWLSIWVNLIVNPQPVLLPILNKYHFPVPQLFGVCGFTIFESYDGTPMQHYFSGPFFIKVEIAIQLLEAAFQFTEGFEGFKLYLTDITPDNVVYDEDTKKVSFIDLDHVVVVDSLCKRGVEWNKTLRHELIECDGCFAYAPSEICSYRESDLNIFAVCQLLRENLHGEMNEGFLYYSTEKTIIDKYYKVFKLLNICVECTGSCVNRFESAKDLLSELKYIIKKLVK